MVIIFCSVTINMNSNYPWLESYINAVSIVSHEQVFYLVFIAFKWPFSHFQVFFSKSSPPKYNLQAYFCGMITNQSTESTGTFTSQCNIHRTTFDIAPYLSVFITYFFIFFSPPPPLRRSGGYIALHMSVGLSVDTPCSINNWRTHSPRTF